jgi:two-component system, NarL family, sensor histidine kinase DevS
MPIEDLLAEWIARTGEVVEPDQRVRMLLHASQAIISELSLPAVLRRIVEAARDLVGAQYGALGVIGPDQTLEQFIHVGMDADAVRSIGDLPKGLGVLGALIADPRPIRLADIAADPRSSGFPDHHPSMTNFLGVPIRSRDQVFGNLYLTDKTAGGDFTRDDEDLVSALAATAGVAIENARLYDATRRRQLAAQASAEISAKLLDPAEHLEPLQFIADTVLRLTSADVVSLVVPSEDPDALRVAVASGEAAEKLVGLRYPAERSLVDLAMDTGRGVRVGAAHAQHGYYVHLNRYLDVGPAMAVPLAGHTSSRGALLAGRHRGRPVFLAGDLELATAFANHAAIAIELVDARAAAERLSVLEDRERIARDLHDHVIQRIFAAGLSLHSLGRQLPDAAARDRLDRVVDDLDSAIHQLRNSIFQLRDTDPVAGRMRGTILHTAQQVAPSLGFDPRIQLTGPLDAVADQALIGDVEAVVREGLTNVARHAAATQVQLNVVADGHGLCVDILDDGCGLPAGGRRSGLRNVRERAQARGGELELGPGADGGTRLHWIVPVLGTST